MEFIRNKPPSSHGDGGYNIGDFMHFGVGIIIENGVLVFHPENISVMDHVYIGHHTILKGYHNAEMHIGEGTWIGSSCFIHSAGGVFIGRAVGIGPNVKILTSTHTAEDIELPVIHTRLLFAKVTIGDGADIGIGSIIMPGVSIGEGAIVGAGSVVTKDIEPYTIAAGVPARIIRNRKSE